MPFRLLMILILVLGAAYMFWARGKESKPVNIPPPPIMTQDVPPPVLTAEQLEKVHEAVKDTDSSVRWAAVELLYQMHDPQALPMLQEVLSLDYDPAVRKKALSLLKNAAEKQAANKPVVMEDLSIALKDSDKEVRIAALLALGEIGDKRLVPQISELVNDSDSEVRLQALHTLSQLHGQRQIARQKLTQELQKEYKEAAHPGETKKNDDRGLFNGIGN